MIRFQEIQPEFVNISLGKIYLNKQSTTPIVKPILETPKIDLGVPEEQFKQELQSLREKDNATDDEIDQAIDLTPSIKDKEKAKGFAKNFFEKLVPSKTYELEPAKAKAKPKNDVSKYLEAFATLETSGIQNPYSFSKFSGSSSLGKDLGRYQVTEGELKTYSKRYLGREITTKEFLENPNLQDEYMTSKINYLISKGASPQRIFEIHRKGHESEKGSADSYSTKGVQLLQ